MITSIRPPSTDAEGVVLERYACSAFGLRRVMNASFVTIGSTNYEWAVGFQGQFLNGMTGFYNYGYRYYSPGPGRWLNRDPLGEVGAANLHAMTDNFPVNKVDFLGLSDHLCCVNSLKAIYDGEWKEASFFEAGTRIVHIQHKMHIEVTFEPGGTIKTIDGRRVCCDPTRCTVRQEVKLNGEGAYQQDGPYREENTDGLLHLRLFNDTPGHEIALPEGGTLQAYDLNYYAKFRALVEDSGGEIVAQKEGYWVQNVAPTGATRLKQVTLLHGGFDSP